jgi:dihydroxyacetone kinase
MERIINDPTLVVEDMLQGFTKAYPHLVAKTDNPRVLKSARAPVSNKVGIVTGGGSGHKPAFIGYIGKNLCDAVAIGDGDHGINMSKGFALAKTRLADQTISVSDGLALIGKTLMTEIGGAMGPIYGTFFIQMSLQAKNKPAIDAGVFGAMVAAARKGVEDLGGAKPRG